MELNAYDGINKCPFGSNIRSESRVPGSCLIKQGNVDIMITIQVMRECVCVCSRARACVRMYVFACTLPRAYVICLPDSLLLSNQIGIIMICIIILLHCMIHRPTHSDVFRQSCTTGLLAGMYKHNHKIHIYDSLPIRPHSMQNSLSDDAFLLYQTSSVQM